MYYQSIFLILSYSQSELESLNLLSWKGFPFSTYFINFSMPNDVFFKPWKPFHNLKFREMFQCLSRSILISLFSINKLNTGLKVNKNVDKNY